MKARWLLLVCMLAVPGVALPVVLGASNLDMFGYPEHDCYKPIKPTKPYDLTDEWGVDSYNREVRRYNTELEIFNQCIQDYLEGAANDIERIKEAAQDAVDEAQRPY